MQPGEITARLSAWAERQQASTASADDALAVLDYRAQERLRRLLRSPPSPPQAGSLPSKLLPPA